MTRHEKTQRLAWLDALADVAKAAAAAARAELETEAREEYERELSAPSWAMAKVATIRSRVAGDEILVSDPAALLAWVQERHPEHIQVSTQVVKSYVDWLLANCEPVAPDQVEVCSPKDDGEVVPGLQFYAGGAFEGLTITFDQPLKRHAREALAPVVESFVTGQVEV